jgi:hypothetical protein
MKDMKKSLKSLRGTVLRMETGFLMAAAGVALPGTVWAEDNGYAGNLLGDDLSGNTQVNAGFNIVKQLIDVATWLFVFMGAFYLLPGLFKLINSLRNNQPEETSSAAKDVAIGIVLLMFKVIWSGVSGKIFGT